MSNDETLLDEILELTTKPAVKPDDITVKRYLARCGLSHATAIRRLDALVAAGVLVRGVAWDPEARRDVTVWQRTEGRL